MAVRAPGSKLDEVEGKRSEERRGQGRWGGAIAGVRGRECRYRVILEAANYKSGKGDERWRGEGQGVIPMIDRQF